MSHAVNGQVYKVSLADNAYDDYLEEMNPFKDLTFAEKVNRLAKYDSSTKKRNNEMIDQENEMQQR